MDEQKYVMKPDNNLALAIFTTVCCCLPFGIMAIIKANSVDSLYMMKQYDAAIMAANEAKKWSFIGIIISLAVWVLYGLFALLFGGVATFLGGMAAFAN